MDQAAGLQNGTAPAEIPQENIATALERRLGTTNFVILGTTLTPLKRIGLLGDHHILTVSYLNKEGNEVSTRFFIKFFPFERKQAAFADGIGAFKKEMFVYDMLDKFREDANDLISSVVPKCYSSVFNKFLILDNLIDESFETVNKTETLDYATVLVILQSLARLHASSIVYEQTTLGKSILEVYGDDLEESFFNDRENYINEVGIRASVVGVKKEIDILNFEPKLRSGKDFAKVVEKVCYRIYELVKPSNKFRNVLTHGDLWATNFLLKRCPKTNKVTGCKFVDFQCGRYAPPAQDVISLLYLNTTRNFREKYMYQLIGMYYSYLEKHLKFAGLDANVLLPFSEFLESCDDQKVFAAIQAAIYFPLILVDGDTLEGYFQDEELYRKAFFEDRSAFVLAYFEKDEQYKNRLLESLRDLKDCCEFL